MSQGFDAGFLVKVVRNTFNGEPSHWEVSAGWNGAELVTGTAPDFYSALDMGIEIGTEFAPDEIHFDANARNK